MSDKLHIYEVQLQNGRTRYRAQRFHQGTHYNIKTCDTVEEIVKLLKKTFLEEAHNFSEPALKRQKLVCQNRASQSKYGASACSVVPKEQRWYRGISYEANRAKGWKVQGSNERFETQMEAARAAAEYDSAPPIWLSVFSAEKTVHVLWPQYMYQVPQGSCSTTAGGYTPPPPPLLLHKNFAGGAPVKLTIARAATAGLVDMTRCVATYIPTPRSHDSFAYRRNARLYFWPHSGLHCAPQCCL